MRAGSHRVCNLRKKYGKSLLKVGYFCLGRPIYKGLHTNAPFEQDPITQRSTNA